MFVELPNTLNYIFLYEDETNLLTCTRKVRFIVDKEFAQVLVFEEHQNPLEPNAVVLVGELKIFKVSTYDIFGELSVSYKFLTKMVRLFLNINEAEFVFLKLKW